MAGAHIVPRTLASGQRRYLVRYRLGGRESRLRHAGSFKSKREAEMRLQWIRGELAAGRVPDLAVERQLESRETIRSLSERWQASRIDVSDATRGVHRKALVHVLAAFGERTPWSLEPREIGTWIVGLAGKYERGTCEKILGALRMVLDFGDVRPNPARDDRVKLPRSSRKEIDPPSSTEVVAIIERAAMRYRLPLIVLEATGMRVGELETLTWADLDETGGRWRVARQNEKGGRGRWINVPPDVFVAVADLVAPRVRCAGDRVFPHVSQARLRTEMARACTAAGIPLYSPHDLRHRRISLWHMQGIPLAQVGQWVGQRNLSVTADIYTHVIADDEIDRGALLASSNACSEVHVTDQVEVK